MLNIMIYQQIDEHIIDDEKAKRFLVSLVHFSMLLKNEYDLVARLLVVGIGMEGNLLVATLCQVKE